MLVSLASGPSKLFKFVPKSIFAANIGDSC